jgi:hypothetical protein
MLPNQGSAQDVENARAAIFLIAVIGLDLLARSTPAAACDRRDCRLRRCIRASAGHARLARATRRGSSVPDWMLAVYPP